MNWPVADVISRVAGGRDGLMIPRGVLIFHPPPPLMCVMKRHAKINVF